MRVEVAAAFEGTPDFAPVPASVPADVSGSGRCGPAEHDPVTGPVLHTARLRLSLLDAGDAAHAALYRTLYTCPEVMRRIAAPLAPRAADAAFGRACAHNLRTLPGHRSWAIECRSGNAPIGLAAMNRDGQQAELGVMLLPERWKSGVSTEAFTVLLDHVFGAMELKSIHAQRADDDHARIIDRLLGPFGFERAAGVARPGQCRWVLHRSRWHAPARD